MAEVVWEINEKFKDSTGNSIHVLQRTLPNLKDAKTEELVPFFHEPSLFQIGSCDLNPPQRVAGILIFLDFSHEALRLKAQIKTFNSGVITEWVVDSAKEARMTVWRVNHVLDTIQVNIHGEQKLYMQTGGSTVSQIFNSELFSINPKPDIIIAEKMFAENAIPSKD